MNFKRATLLATSAVVTGLLLGASTVQAATVIFSGNNATGIRDLDLDGILYDVDFVFDSSNNVYGPNTPNFDWENEERAFAALTAVNAALNTEPAVETVGPQRSSSFYIGADEERGVSEDLTVAVVGAYSPADAPSDWAVGDEGTVGVVLLNQAVSFTYADFTDSSTPPPDSTGSLEVPGNGATLSGIGLIRGWICDAVQVEVEIDGDPNQRYNMAYGTNRPDTSSVCGDSNNGYGLLINWNELGDGSHSVRVLVDGAQNGSAAFTVQTLGSPYRTGASGIFTLPDFPEAGEEVDVEWLESIQNFMIIDYRQ